MRIAFFTEGYDPFINGVVTSIRTLSCALRDHGHEVTIFAPEYPGHVDVEADVVRLPGIKWSDQAYPCLSPAAALCDVLAGEDFDVVHSHHPFTMSLLAARCAKRNGLPLVYSFHTLLEEYGYCFGPLEVIGRRWLARRYVKHCAQSDEVVVSTPSMQAHLRTQGVTQSITVIPAGVLLPALPSGGKGSARSELGLPDDIPALLYVGRLSHEKRVDLLLDSMARLAEHYEFRLCIAGGGPEESKLRERAAELGLEDKVVFRGWVPHAEIGTHYGAADVFVFPSPSDTMGIVLVEAMGCGLPCVAVDRYGPSDVVRDGITGFLVPFDEKAFADATQTLMRNPALRRLMKREALLEADRYRPEVVAQCYVQLYERLVSVRRAQSLRAA